MKKGSSKLFAQIKQAVSSGALKQPFTVADVNNACNGLLAKSPTFLSKHEENNPGKYHTYFKRVSTGKYKILCNNLNNGNNDKN